jgi:hypothetical protein
VFISGDSLLCLLVNMLIAYYTTCLVRDNDRMLLIVLSGSPYCISNCAIGF